MKKYRSLLLLLSYLLVAPLYAPLCAIEQLEVQALMPGLVVLNVDGSRTSIKKGQTSEQGITLISSTTQSAVLEINGEQKTYRMGTTVSVSFTQRDQISEQIFIDKYGMFRAHGSINNQSVRFLIDTGASSVAMSAKDARRLGIQYRLNGRPVTTHTASGTANGWAIKLKSVRLGQLVERNVRGMVIDGDYPQHVLLGMTFLNRMKVEKEGQKMTIIKKK
ncbi:hypothetical protein MNBD_GAMMA09-2214 [hydrothermal vent metagenome]|uniref:TIGR02281 family clan AA aspartic protease n=1 Tax=hydrothermal vent metagenome TaxID=652676 RepID=A0A3B0YQ15_9ZZZZ